VAEDRLASLGSATEISFGVVHEVAGPLKATQQLTAQLRAVVAPRADVRTCVEHTCLAWNVVDLLGRVQTVHATSSTAEFAALHSRGVALMLRFRAYWCAHLRWR